MKADKSWEGSPVERRKSRKSNPVVSTVEGSHVRHRKSRKISSVVRMASYAKILKISILPS